MCIKLGALRIKFLSGHPTVRSLYAIMRTALMLWLFAGCGTSSPPSTTITPTSPTIPPAPVPTPPPQLATWTNSFDGVPFTMVGRDPMQPNSGTTNIPAVIIPVVFNFNGLIISPNNVPCTDTINALARVSSSPIFTNLQWNSGAISLGNTQFGDAFQRANFWSIISKVSPNYHVMLSPITISSPEVVNVPFNIGAVLSPNPLCSSQPYASLPIGFMDAVVQSVVADQKLTANMLPIFLTYDTSFIPPNAVFLGYHNHQGSQTYIVASYMDSGFQGVSGYQGVSDVAILSHEIGEWMDNPLGINKVPAWGGYGIQQVCGTDLEVGDPLTSHVFVVPDPISHFQYHIQELAYFSWFARNYPSLAANGLYSSEGTFPTFAPPCI